MRKLSLLRTHVPVISGSVGVLKEESANTSAKNINEEVIVLFTILGFVLLYAALNAYVTFLLRL